MHTQQPSNAGGTFQFRTPADIQDFADNPPLQAAMNQLWNDNLNGFIEQGMLSNPWNSTNTPPTTNYYNPIVANPPSDTAPVTWKAFPGRLAYNFPDASQSQLDQMADTGVMPGDISDNPCGQATQKIPYYPYGPRGWQDEYCEWAVTCNGDRKITRIDFTCENPEYWNSLWLIDPNKVLSLYQSILDKPQITLADLSVPGVTNPITNGPIYNPLNKWNSGVKSDASQGGAIHLTSTPNTLQTEIGLATAATVQRNHPEGGTNWPSSQYNELLCDAQYGQKNRNSDPNIGGNVNNLVTAGTVVTLADPPGLYIQMPDFSSYTTPDGTDASTFWQIKRGSLTLNEQNGTPLPGNFILHAVFEVPSDLGYVVGDITIGGSPIDWGSQVADTFKMQIVASGYAGTTPAGYGPVGDLTPAYAQPLQLFYADYFNVLYNTPISNPVNNPIPLLSNSTYIPPTIFLGANSAQMVIVCNTCTAVQGQPATYPQVSFDDPNISAVVTSVQQNVSYAVPGNSMPGNYTAVFITVAVGANTAIGRRGVYVTNSGQTLSTAMPALLIVAPTTVQANIAWQDTGIVLSPNNTANIQYTGGLWTANPNDNYGQLYNAAGNPVFIAAKPGYTLPGQDEGALIARVGTQLFLVGLGTTLPTGLSGALALCINDDLNGQYGAGLTDNIGSVTVSITVQ